MNFVLSLFLGRRVITFFSFLKCPRNRATMRPALGPDIVALSPMYTFSTSVNPTSLLYNGPFLVGMFSR